MQSIEQKQMVKINKNSRQWKRDSNIYRYGERILFIGFFLVAFILCGFISYSDGDDVYFSGMAHSMPFFEYLKMRYIGWEGRMTSEAMTYIAFYFGKGFWQLMNAIMLTLLPAGLLHILKKMTGGMTEKKSFLMALVIYLLTLSVGIEVIGYGAFWITGSTFYLWSIVAGIWAVMPFVDLVYQKEKLDKRSFIYAIPCGFIAAMGQEQIAAVVIAFGALAIGYDFWRQYAQVKEQDDTRHQQPETAEHRQPEAAGHQKMCIVHRISWWHLAEEVIMLIALILLFVSPGTGARTQSEIETWMPQYSTMSLGNHIFITLQWILSSFANEGKMLFVVLWLAIMLLLLQRHDKRSRMLACLCGIETIVALLPYAGITWFSEMGMGDVGMTQCVAQVATPESVSGQNWIAMIWWSAAIIFMIAMLWQTEEQLRDKVVLSLFVLAACASEAIMFFSPTMYASGPRVYFMAQILLWLLAGRMCGKLLTDDPLTESEQEQGMQHRQAGYAVVVIVAMAGVMNVVSGVSVVLTYL